MPKISIIILLLELQTQIGLIELASPVSITTIDNISIGKEILTTENTIYLLKNLLLISSLLSLIIGTIVGLAQSKIKRLLAYSTISHIGFILLALAINTEQSIESLLFYIIQYSITNLNTFLIIIALGLLIHNKFNNNNNLINIEEVKGSENDISLISELKGQFFSNPLLSLSLAICLFSMAGIPPLIGFFSKQFVLYSAIQNGYYFMSIIAIIVSIISASYYLKIIKVLHSDDTEINNSLSNIQENSQIKTLPLGRIIEDNNSESIISNFHSFLISSLTLSIILFILKPSLILNSTTLLSLSLYNF
jgi:NADH-ubiquinone oxidoreductase chain 2